MTICQSCNENTTDQLNHTRTSKDLQQVTVCDYCYQDITTLKKINGKWLEITNLDGVEYFI